MRQIKKTTKKTTIETYTTEIEVDESACETEIIEGLKICKKSNDIAPDNFANLIVMSLPLKYLIFIIYLQ